MHILRLSCIDKPGIVAATASALADAGCNIEESAQFHDQLSQMFFMRVHFVPQNNTALDEFEEAFQAIADDFSMKWAIYDAEKPLNTLILVSKPDHCLNDLLYRWRSKNLPINIAAIASNHEDSRNDVEQFGLPFHHLSGGKAEQEKTIDTLIENTGAELTVLARYMQILSSTICEKHAGNIINIHHSFLPGFKGARPYHQAYERGVKIIGATAHFVTRDLDEGPIITQGVAPVTHADSPDTLMRIGQDNETRVLAEAVRLYAQRRIFVHGSRTIIL